ncbi:MAG: hypothetical protein P8Y48_18005, partial [Novosphingobium sp.]
MTNRKRLLREVVGLPYYGRSFPFVPWTLRTKLRVSLTFLGELRRELGWGRFLGFWLALPFRIVPALREGHEGYRMTRRSFGVLAEMEWLLLVIMFRILTRIEGPERAYNFTRRAIQKAAVYMMPEYY